MALAAGLDDERNLRAGGFGDAEINQWKAETTQQLQGAGFSSDEIAQHFGAKSADMGYMKTQVKQNLDNRYAPATPEGQPKEAKSFEEAFLAGLQISTTGLAMREKMPDTVLPEHAGMAMGIVKSAGTLAGDLPAMVAGGVFGSAAGSEIPVVGNVAGAAAGAWGLPPALRQAYVDHIQKGDIKSFGDFWERTAAIGWEAAKGATIGVATQGVGGLASGALAKTALSPVIQGAGTMASELATMTTIGAGLENKVPKPEDFAEAAALMAGLHAVTSSVPHIEAKLQDVYAKTGLSPAEVGTQMKQDPVLAQEILSNSPEFPKSLKPVVEADPTNPQPKTVEAKFPDDSGEKLPGLTIGFSDDAREAIESKIGKPTEPKDKPLSFDSTRAKVIDSLDPIKKLTDAITDGEKLPKGEQPYVLFGKAQSQAFERAHQAINRGPVDFDTGKPTGAPSLKTIMQPFADDPQGFKNYWLARRTLEVDDRGIKTVIDPAAAQEYVTQNSAKYGKAFKQIVEWQNSGLDDLQKSGVLSAKQVEEIKAKNQDYVPLNTYRENGEAGGKSRYSLNPIKALKGNESDLLVDPIESMIRNRYAFSKLAEQNVARQSLVDLAKRFDAPPELLQKVKTASKPMDVSPDELVNHVAKYGVYEGNDPDTLTIWRPQAEPLKENQFAIMKDGKREVYQVDPAVAKAFQAVGESTPSNMLLQIPNAIAKAQRIGITADPFFLLKHGIRDQFSASIYSNNGYRFAWDGLRGLGEIFKDSDKWNEFLANGGGMSTLSDFHKDYIQNDIWGLSEKTGLLDKAKNVVKTPYERMEMIAKMVFNAPKMGEFMRAQEAGKDMVTSVDDARNVTPNVQRMGSAAWVKGWSAATPFATMRIRGMDQMVQILSDPETRTRTLTKMGLAITIPSIVTWWLHKDDSRYQDAPRWEKDLFWLHPTDKWELTNSIEDFSSRPPDLRRSDGDQMWVNNGETMRIPKPFEPGLLFGSTVERALQQYYYKDPHAFKGFAQALIGDALPNVMPATAVPMLEQMANRSWLTGGNLIPHSLEGVSPEAQYTPYTSETAKALGKLIGFVPGAKDIGTKDAKITSPIILDNYIRAWTGTLGQYAVQLVDKGIIAASGAPPPPKPASTLADIPFIKAFVVRHPSAAVQPIQDFFDNFHDTDQTIKTAMSFSKRGDEQKWQEFMNRSETKENFIRLDGIEKTLSAQMHVIQTIYLNKEMSPNDKRQAIDTAYYQMTEMARNGNNLLETHRKQVRESLP